MNTPAAQVHFVDVVIPAFRSALIGRDAIVQGRGEFFISVVNEMSADHVFEFDLESGGILHRINGEFLNDGTVRIRTSPGTTQDYVAGDLTRQIVENIVANWWRDIEAARRTQ